MACTGSNHMPNKNMALWGVQWLSQHSFIQVEKRRGKSTGITALSVLAFRQNNRCYQNVIQVYKAGQDTSHHLKACMAFTTYSLNSFTRGDPFAYDIKKHLQTRRRVLHKQLKAIDRCA